MRQNRVVVASTRWRIHDAEASRAVSQCRHATHQTGELIVCKFAAGGTLCRHFFRGGPAERETEAFLIQSEAVFGGTAAHHFVGRLDQLAHIGEHALLVGGASLSLTNRCQRVVGRLIGDGGLPFEPIELESAGIHQIDETALDVLRQRGTADSAGTERRHR
jgi:hypothetical protein